LALQNFRTGSLDVEPLRSIDLWEKLDLTGAWRPLDAERIADQPFRVPIVFDGPRVDVLAARLLHGAERHEGPFWREAGLLDEFADCSIRSRLAIEDFAFRNRPGAVVLVPPIGTAGMCEQHFETVMIAE
jgi:hypothetical protein